MRNIYYSFVQISKDEYGEGGEKYRFTNGEPSEPGHRVQSLYEKMVYASDICTVFWSKLHPMDPVLYYSEYGDEILWCEQYNS